MIAANKLFPSPSPEASGYAQVPRTVCMGMQKPRSTVLTSSSKYLESIFWLPPPLLQCSPYPTKMTSRGLKVLAPISHPCPRQTSFFSCFLLLETKPLKLRHYKVNTYMRIFRKSLAWPRKDTDSKKTWDLVFISGWSLEHRHATINQLINHFF